jgi:hypothetical protein
MAFTGNCRPNQKRTVVASASLYIRPRGYQGKNIAIIIRGRVRIAAPIVLAFSFLVTTLSLVFLPAVISDSFIMMS